MSFYYTRHGETSWNKEGKVQGRIDVPLNEKGLEEAKELQKKLKDIPIDICFCSPLIRAKRTAEIALEGRDIPIIEDNRIIEQYYGDFEGKERFTDAVQAYRQSYFKTYPNGEGYKYVILRVYQFLNEIREKYKDKNVLVVAHGGISRVVNSYFMDMENEEFTHFVIDNCELKKYEFDQKVDFSDIEIVKP